MAVAFDALSPSATAQSAATTTSITWSHTASGADRYVVVGVALGNSNPRTLTVTYGGISMTSLGLINSNNSTVGFFQLFGLVAPLTGARTVLVTPSAVCDSLIGGSISFTGVNQGTSTATPVTAFGPSGTPSVNVPTVAAGNMVVDGLATGTAVLTTTQTSRWLKNLNTATGAGNGAQSTAAATGGTVAMSYTITSDFWGMIAVELLAASVDAPLPTMSAPGLFRGPSSIPDAWFGSLDNTVDASFDTVTPVAGGAIGGAGTASASGTASTAALPGQALGAAGSASASGAATVASGATAALGGPGRQTIAETIFSTAGRASGSSGTVTATGAATVAGVPNTALAGPLTSSVTGAATVSGVPGAARGSGTVAAISAAATVAAQPSRATGQGVSTPVTGTAAISATSGKAAGQGVSTTTTGAATVGSAAGSALGAGTLASATATTLQSALPAGALALGGLATITAAATLAALAGSARGAGPSIGPTGAATVVSFPSVALGRPGTATALTTVVVFALPSRAYAGAGKLSIGEVFVPTAPSPGQIGPVKRPTAQITAQDVDTTGILPIRRASASATTVDRESTTLE